MGARGWMSLLFHGAKMAEVVEVAWRSGLLEQLDEGATLATMAETQGMVEGRLYKLLDCLEAMALVVREDAATVSETWYRSAEPLTQAAALVFGERSIERDREEQPWRAIHGRLEEVLAGGEGVGADRFAWPPATKAQAERFAASMAAGVPPIVESFRAAPDVFGVGEAIRVLDVGGGNGALARALAEGDARLRVDVLELPELAEAARANLAKSPASARLGFVEGDALGAPLPEGYDVILFVRMLHDWPAEVARGLLQKATVAPRVVISEEMRTPERLAIQAFWSYFLIGVDSCVSRLREWSRYVEWLGALGYECRLVEGAFDIGVATR